jgi:hypothetical protein
VFGGFIKSFDSIDKEALWFKMRLKGASDNVIQRIKRMCNGAKLCVKCGGDEVTFF